MMKLTVKNFGPIREAKDVVVGPMTVFVGPSNTGKSYLAVLIYSIMKVLSVRGRMSSFRYSLDAEGILGSDMKSVKFNNQKNTFKIISKMFFAWANLISENWREEVLYCFGAEAENMIKNAPTLEIKISDTEEKLCVNLCSPANSKLALLYKTELLASIKENKMLQHYLVRYADIQNDPDQIASAEEGEVVAEVLRYRILNGILETLLSKFFSDLVFNPNEIKSRENQSHYLPAIRGGIMQSHRTLVSALIARAPTAGLRAISSIPPFTGVLSDFMTKLMGVGSSPVAPPGRVRLMSSQNKTRFATIRRIGADVEQKIMDGKINVKMSEAEYPDFRYAFESGKKKHDLPLMSVSSMVSELAPVSLFIRYYVNPGDLFIVEEPEAHLHPGAQRDIANILVQLVNAGVRVMITTHSDTMIEQISNYVHAFDVGKKVRGQSLSKENIATYLFDRPKTSKQKSTKVEKISFHPEKGILTKDHLAVSTSLYKEIVGLLEEKES